MGVMLRFWKEFILAVGFLTRLAPARIADEETLGRSIRWFPVVGFCLGIVLAVPFVLGLGDGFPGFQAWFWLGAAMVLTRGLHWDGWVDLCDAWGSGAGGARFWEVLKDSRMGAFGAMGLVMGLAGFLVILPEIFLRREWGLLIWAPVLGRSAAVILAWRVRELARPGLAAIFLSAVTKRRAALVAGLALAVGIACVSWSVLFLAGLVCCAGLFFLSRLARLRGGVNGDFLGVAIVWGELSVLVGWIVRGA